MAHIHDKIDFTVDVFIVHKDKVLLRMHDKYHLWLAVGGHIELDEDPVQAAIREVKEEVGLDIVIPNAPFWQEEKGFTSLATPKYLNRHDISPTHEHISLVYFATSDTDDIRESASEHERAETKWATMDELKEMDLRPNILFYATEALKELGTKH